MNAACLSTSHWMLPCLIAHSCCPVLEHFLHIGNMSRDARFSKFVLTLCSVLCKISTLACSFAACWPASPCGEGGGRESLEVLASWPESGTTFPLSGGASRGKGGTAADETERGMDKCDQQQVCKCSTISSSLSLS